MQELHEILSAMVAQKEKVRDRRELLLDMADRIVKTREPGVFLQAGRGGDPAALRATGATCASWRPAASRTWGRSR